MATAGSHPDHGRQIPALVTKWSAIGLSSIAVGVLLRSGLIKLFTAWNGWQYASRPELENWVLPGYGTEVPATLCALSVLLLGAAALAATHAVRHWRVYPPPHASGRGPG